MVAEAKYEVVTFGVAKMKMLSYKIFKDKTSQ